MLSSEALHARGVWRALRQQYQLRTPCSVRYHVVSGGREMGSKRAELIARAIMRLGGSLLLGEAPGSAELRGANPGLVVVLITTLLSRDAIVDSFRADVASWLPSENAAPKERGALMDARSDSLCRRHDAAQGMLQRVLECSTQCVWVSGRGDFCVVDSATPHAGDRRGPRPDTAVVCVTPKWIEACVEGARDIVGSSSGRPNDDIREYVVNLECGRGRAAAVPHAAIRSMLEGRSRDAVADGVADGGAARDARSMQTGGFLPIFFGSETAAADGTLQPGDRATDEPTRAKGTAAASWEPASPEQLASRRTESSTSPFLSEREARTVEYLRRNQPFACQRPLRSSESAPRTESATDNIDDYVVSTYATEHNSDDTRLYRKPSGVSMPGVEANRVEEGAAQLAARSRSRDNASVGLVPSAHDETTGTAKTANSHLLSELQSLRDVYVATGDSWREYAYNKAIAVISKLPFEVTEAAQLRGQRAIGARLLNKVEEILAMGTSTKLQRMRERPEVAACFALTQIWGVGASTAKRLYAAGYRTLDDLRAADAENKLGGVLTASQRIGLKHCEDLLERIPRAEVAAIEAAVVAIAERLRLTGGIELTTCGSYRRGKSTSGDVDILVCDRSGRRLDGLLDMIVAEMNSDASAAASRTSTAAAASDAAGAAAHGRFSLVECLSHGTGRSREEAHRSDSWFGVVALQHCRPESRASCPCAHRLDPITGLERHLVRRLDLKAYPSDQYAFAVLYFTGSDYFNRSMRLFAQKQGFSLSDKELRPVVRVAGDKVHEGQQVPCSTERDIFVALGLPYKPPDARDIE